MKYKGIQLKKKFGQNFLTDSSIAEYIAAEIGSREPRSIIEIGAGTGALTEHLLGKAAELFVLEIDVDCVHYLEKTFGDSLKIVSADANKFDFGTILQEQEKTAVCGNLPYNSAVHIMKQVSIFRRRIDYLVFMLQKEVAEKICSQPGDSEYSSLSVYFQYRYQPEIIRTVGKGNFLPSPKVDSALLQLVPREEQKTIDKSSEKKMDQVVDAAFRGRRKKLLNSFAMTKFLGFGKEEFLEILEELAIDSSKRPDRITVDEYEKLAKRLSMNKT